MASNQSTINPYEKLKIPKLGFLNPYGELKIPKLGPKHKELTGKEEIKIEDLIIKRVYKDIDVKKVVKIKRGEWSVDHNGQLRRLLEREIILAREATNYDPNKHQTPEFLWRNWGIRQEIAAKILERPEYKEKPRKTEHSFQDLLDNLGIEYYSIPYGKTRTIERNHHSPVIACATIKPARYAVGIVKTPKTYSCFELCFANGRTTCRIIDEAEALGTIEKLKNNPIRIEEKEEELSILKQKTAIEAL